MAEEIKYYQSEYSGEAIDEAINKVNNIYELLYSNEIPANSFLIMIDNAPTWVQLQNVEDEGVMN